MAWETLKSLTAAKQKVSNIRICHMVFRDVEVYAALQGLTFWGDNEQYFLP